MDYFSLPLLVVYGFLLLNLVVGFWVGHGTRTVQEYALANRSISTGILTITILSTFIGLGSLNFPYYAATEGLSVQLVIIFFDLLCFILLGCFLARNMVYFKGAITMGDVMGRLYGKTAQWLTGIVGLIFTLILVSAQIRSMGIFAHALLGVNATLATCCLGGLLIFYAFIGGMRAVAFTDVLQFIALVLSCSFLAHMLLSEVGGLHAFWAKIKTLMDFQGGDKPWRFVDQVSDIGQLDELGNPKEHAITILGPTDFFTATKDGFLCNFLPIFLLTGPVVQRMLMVKNKKSARNMFLVGGLVNTLIALFLVFIGFVGLIYHKEHHALENYNRLLVISDDFIIVLTESLCATHPLIKGLLFCGFLAVVMSTADSHLHAAGISFVQDVLKPFSSIKNRNETTVMRLFVLLVGALSILIAVGVADGAGYSSYTIASLFYPIVLIPFILGVLGMQTNAKLFFTFFIVYSLVTFPCYSFTCKEMTDGYDTFAFLIGSFVALVAYLVLHIKRYGKISFVQHKDREKWWGRPVQRHFSWDGLKEWVQEKVAQPYGSLFLVLFIVFHVLTFWLPFENALAIPVMTIHGISLGLCVLLLLHPVWPYYLRKYIGFFWLFTLFFTLAFAFPFFSLVDATSSQSAIRLASTIILLILLIDFEGFLVLFGLGVLGACILFAALVKEPNFTLEVLWNMIIGLFPALTMGYFLAKKKEEIYQKEQKRLSAQNKEQAELLSVTLESQKQLTSSLARKSSMVNEIHQVADILKSSKEEGQAKLGERLESAIMHISHVGQQAMDYLPLTLLPSDTKNFLQTLFSIGEDQGETWVDQVDLPQEYPDATLVWDHFYMSKLLRNSLTQLALKHPEQKIAIQMAPAILDYGLPGEQQSNVAALHIRLQAGGQLEGLPVGKRHTIEEAHAHTDILYEVPSLGENIRIAASHYGICKPTVLQHTDQQDYVIPLDVRSIKPTINIFADEDLAEETWLDAIEDQRFLRNIKPYKHLNLPRIEHALRIAKHYHRKQKRHSGGPYYLHPIAVATLALEYDKNKDEEVIIACLLHDVIEDTAYTLHQLRTTFGEEVTSIVNEVTHLYSHENRKLKLAKQETLVSLLKNANPKPLFVKLMDRLHNMETIYAHPSLEKQQSIAQETLDFFLVVADALDLKDVRIRLEELCSAVITQ